MHFTKTLVSFFALGSFASASFYEADESVDLAARKAEFLQARAEYIEARDNYIMEKRGSAISRPKTYEAHKGVCFAKECKEEFPKGKFRVCSRTDCKKKRDGAKCTCDM
ncbi:unnamed protein product [Clonostachys chloroleuca]|uniref:Uncharacterized protein n=1 Tax=Clonostachys chloroleuca TaxID=1926264 RepID=A0AA35Q797_9HYPO|nr:unnamed protein product [Clonostachys chloroleuca]